MEELLPNLINDQTHRQGPLSSSKDSLILYRSPINKATDEEFLLAKLKYTDNDFDFFGPHETDTDPVEVPPDVP